MCLFDGPYRIVNDLSCVRKEVAVLDLPLFRDPVVRGATWRGLAVTRLASYRLVLIEASNRCPPDRNMRKGRAIICLLAFAGSAFNISESYTSVEEAQTFDDARKTCGEDRHLLNLEVESDELALVGISLPLTWLDMRIVGGFYHWLDPLPRVVLLVGPMLYDQQISGWSPHHECAALKFSSGTIETRDCNEKLPFVCSPPQGARNASVPFNVTQVTLESNLSPVLFSWELRDFVLTCKATLANGEQPDQIANGVTYAYVWTKNGVYLYGNERGIQPDKVGEITAVTYTNESSQGHYRCGVKVLPAGETVWSDVVTVVLRDFYTQRVNALVPANSTNVQRVNIIGPSFAELTNISHLVQAQSGNAYSWSFSRAELGNDDLLNVSLFTYVKRRRGAELDPHSTRQDISAILSQQWGALAVEFYDVVRCPPEGGQHLRWLNQNHISAESSNPMCLTGSYELIPRRCLINFTSEATWAPYDESHCVHLHPDPVGGRQAIPTVCNKTLGSCTVALTNNASTLEEARETCRRWHAYLPGTEALTQQSHGGTWTGLKRKHGYLQQENAADTEALPALATSQKWAPYMLSEKFYIGNNVSDISIKKVGGALMQGPRNEHLASRCLPRYKNGLLSIASCPKGGWLDVENGSRCLWLNHTRMSFVEAQGICQLHGGRLATFKGNTTYHAITAIIAQSTISTRTDAFWIGLKKLDNGSYRWIDGAALDTSNWHPSTDYSRKAGQLRVNYYAAERVLQVKWSLAAPWMEYPFICEAPLKTDTPWLRVEMKRSDDSVNFTCFASPEIVEGTVMWYKDGLALHGDRTDGDSNYSTLRLRSATKNSPYLQGYYWCEGLSIDGLREVESRKKLLRFSQLKTFACSIEIKKTEDTPALTDLSSKAFVQFANKFQSVVTSSKGSEGLAQIGADRLSDVNVLRLSHVKAGTYKVHFAAYFVAQRRPTRRSIHEEATDEESTISVLKAGLLQPKEYLVNNLGVLPGTAEVFSTRFCSNSTTSHRAGLHRTLHWPATAVGGIAMPDEVCIGADNRPVVRLCDGNYTVGAYWGEVRGNCDVLPSRSTIDLKNLSMVYVTSSNVLSTTAHLQNLTSQAMDLEPQGVVYAATTLANIGSVQRLNREVAEKVVSSLDNIINANTTSLSLSRAANSTNMILNSMEEVSAALESPGVVFDDSTALGKLPLEKILNGIALSSSTKEWYNFSHPEELTGGTDVAIVFPRTAGESCGFQVSNPANVTLGLLSHNALFQSSSNALDVACTPVLLVRYEECDVEHSDQPYSFYFRDNCAGDAALVQSTVECVFWDVQGDDNYGSWSSEGCYYVGKMDHYHVCNCTHLTSFGILFKSKDVKTTIATEVHEVILSFLTFIGVGLSMLGLLMVVITYVLSEKWRKGVGHKCLLNLSLSLLGSLATFSLLAIFREALRSSSACVVMGALLHYLLLVAFAWTFVEAILQYLRFVKVLGTYIPHFVLKCAFPAWGVPLAAVAAVLSLGPEHYNHRQHLCWLQGKPLLFAFILPVGLVLAANGAVFSIVIFNIYFKRQKGLRSNQSQVALAKAQLRATICIVFLLGLTWLFAYFTIIDAYGASKLFEYLFVVFATLQGFIIFLFHVAYEKTARELWMRKVWWLPGVSKQGLSPISGDTTSSSAQKTTST